MNRCRTGNERNAPAARAVAGLLLIAMLVAGCSAGEETDDSLKPENLRLPAMTLVCGGDEVLSGGTYDFGAAEIGETRSVECRIYNNKGQEDLQVFYLGFAGPGQSPFSIDDSDADEYIAPNGYTAFTLAYSPVEMTGVQSEIVYIINNDAEEGGFSFRIAGSCENREIIVSGKVGQNDRVCALAAGTGGALYAAGYGTCLVSASSGRDWWLKKYDAGLTELDFNGDLLAAWNTGTSPCTKSGNDLIFDGGTPFAQVNAVAVDGSGDVYAVGFGTDLAGADSYYDCWIRKFDQDGTEILSGWDKKLDGLTGTAGYDDVATCVAVHGSDVYVAGYSKNRSTTATDWWIKKYDENGNDSLSAFNTTLNDNTTRYIYVTSMAIDADGYVYAGGYGWDLVSYATASEDDASAEDWWIKKLDPATGSGVWTQIYGTDSESAYNKTDILNAMALDGAGGLFLAGSGDGDFMIKKLSTGSGTADASWNKVFTNDGGGSEASAVAVAPDGSVFVAGCGNNLVSGTSGDDWWIKKFDSSAVEDTGNWDLRLDYDGGGDQPAAIIAQGDYLFVAGWAWSYDEQNNKNDNWWIRRFDQ